MSDKHRKHIKRFKEMLSDLPLWHVKRIKRDIEKYEGDEDFINACDKEINLRKERVS